MHILAALAGLLTATVWRDEHGDISGYHGIIRDITEQKRIERELLAYQRKLRSLSSQLSLAEERQRRQIAVGLHDGIGQALAMVKIKLAVLQNRLSSGADGGLLEEVSGLIEKTITEARSLVFELSPPILYELGLEAAVDWLVEQMKTRYAINYQFVDDNRPKPLADDVRVLLFQTVRELLMNVAKHARAQHVVVSMCGDGDNIRITVTDDGVGFDTGELQSHPERGNAFGLFSIRERMSFVGGHIEISSEPGHGSQVVAVAPLKKGRVSPRREHHECQNHHCR
ncbi:MAG: sensor histidine kinase [Chloroflexota bacterium]